MINQSPIIDEDIVVNTGWIVKVTTPEEVFYRHPNKSSMYITRGRAEVSMKNERKWHRKETNLEVIRVALVEIEDE